MNNRVHSTIAKVKAKCEKYPDFDIEVTVTSIAARMKSGVGFTAWMIIGDGRYTVGFDGWHEHFASEEDALKCFAAGISGECRLVTYLRGGTPYRWTVEYRDGDKWRRDRTTGLLWFPFWRRREVNVLQNRLLGES